MDVNGLGKSAHTYCINAGQLHADVDDDHGEDLPAHGAVKQERPHRHCVHGGEGSLLLLHFLDLRLDVAFGPVPLQS